MKHLILYTVLLCMTVSCVYPYDVPELENPETRLLVDGSIVVGDKATLQLWTVVLGSIKYDNVSVKPGSWWVEDDHSVKYDVDASGAVPLAGAPLDRSYRIVFTYKGKTYSSSFEKSIAPPVITSLEFDADDSRVYCRVSFEESSDGSGYVAVRSDEIWNFHTDFKRSVRVNTETWEYMDANDTSRYYCWYHDRNMNEAIVDLRQTGGKAEKYVAKAFLRLGSQNHREYNIRVYVRSISESEYRYKQNLNTQQEGYNLFTPNPGDVPGNVLCESDGGMNTLGYVISSASSTIDGKLDSRYRISKPINLDEYFRLDETADIRLYYEIYHLVPLYQGQNYVYWGPEACVDCTLMGGVLEKPEF